ncbi:50S ribosomal protein L11 methyltransferase [Solirubrobacter sp. CPCC 204708]|uniref:50S ribosomal protein L11 methyltransferase n=1 Tax=Solirubrobacter deserti TaxID=2282478 RepID=A0ABT4RSE6_9ACTN|nr:50S ribosomal protein L11 methyltransferase [Solirubrobacter deserti]MBE2316282.1 50S ribosomal protein L11 methyltransferase [Solirubrobacter deserti]MDA0141489.1 50S ribosomal protein L11 methyltransferase [Solirubrobacter deserti]
MIRIGFRVRAQDAEVAYVRLEPLLAAGFEEVADGEHVELVVYGKDVPDVSFPELVSVSRTLIADGWSTAWHEHLAPVTVGSVTVRPPWLPGPGLVVDPGDTFGLASHPTTQLCLALLQELPPTALADWGCGCGVLAAVGAQLGFTPVAGYELDPAAVETARGNGVEAHVADVTTGVPWARTVVANLTAALIANMGGQPAPTEPATVVMSGVLVAHADVPIATFGPLGFVERERRELEGWAAVVMEAA